MFVKILKMKTFIIGDIHGCFDELIALVQQMGLRDEDLLIALGDIVDRGPQSKEVYTYFRNRPNSVVLMGNHERKHLNNVLSYAQEIVKVQFGADYEAFLHWLRILGYYYETEEAIIIHAAFEHDKLLKEQKEEVLCGSTAGDRYLEKKYAPETYWNDYYTGEKPIIYGHHVVGDTLKIKNNTYGIDTGCCHGGYLTAVELPGFIVHQVRAQKDYWKGEQKLWQIPVLEAKDWKNMEIALIYKQSDKLAYIEEEEIRTYINAKREWVHKLVASIPDIKMQLDSFTKDLLETHSENFVMEANKYFFKTFLFKSRAKNLTLADVEKILNTPHKIIEISKALGLQ